MYGCESSSTLLAVSPLAFSPPEFSPVPSLQAEAPACWLQEDVAPPAECSAWQQARCEWAREVCSPVGLPAAGLVPACWVEPPVAGSVARLEDDWVQLADWSQAYSAERPAADWVRGDWVAPQVAEYPADSLADWLERRAVPGGRR